MPTEDELRDLLGRQEAPNHLDPKRIVRSSRARRIPQQIAAGGAGVLAVAGITVLGIQVIPFGQLSGGSPTVAEQSQEADDSTEFSQGGDAVKRLPADRINLCGAIVSEPFPSFAPLQLDVIAPASAPAGGDPVAATVRMTNIGIEPVTGTSPSAPAVTLSQDGVTLWHSNGPVDASAVVVDLDPGESMDFAASFIPVRCAPEDDALEQFRPDLPALPAGAYDLSAVIDFTSDVPTPTTEIDLIMGPRAPLVLE